MLSICQCLTSHVQLQALARHLALPQHQRAALLHDDQQDSQQAGYEILKTFMDQTDDQQQALQTLVLALEALNMDDAAEKVVGLSEPVAISRDEPQWETFGINIRGGQCLMAAVKKKDNVYHSQPGKTFGYMLKQRCCSTPGKVRGIWTGAFTVKNIPEDMSVNMKNGNILGLFVWDT